MKKLQDFILLKNLFTYSKLKDFFKTLKFGNIKKGDYSYYQKIVSGALIFFILFNLGLRVPFLQFFAPKTHAENKDFYNLVSVIVNEDIYSGVESKLKRYAKDIESVLDNTKVVLIPTPQNASAFQIASLIESLYYEGYKSVKPDIDFESKLVGTVLVGDIPLPVVKNGDNFSKTILPYTDFDNKTYVYDNKEKIYKKSENLNEKIEPEIWHGVISPNSTDYISIESPFASTSKKEYDIKVINDYFDKDHDFYTGKGLFGKKESFLGLKTDEESGKGLINGNPEEEPLESYVPYIFYFDQFREIEAINAINYNGYKAKQENKEDIVYNRFSKKLAQDVKDKVLGKEEEELTANINDVFSGTKLPNGDVIGVKKADDPEPGEQANGNRYHFKFSHPGAYYGENITVYYGCNEHEFQVANGAERVDMPDGRLWKPIADVGGNLVILGPADVELETATIRRDGGEESVTFTDSKSGVSDYQSDDAIKKSPDILSRYPTTETLKSFVEIFNFSALGELRKNIYNAGRYSEPKDTVNAHFIPLLISVLDLISEQVIKNANDKIEDKIDSVVKEGGSSKIIMFEKYTTGYPSGGSSYNQNSQVISYKGSNEKIYPLLKPIPFLSSIYADSGLSVSYYNGAPEPALNFAQGLTSKGGTSINVGIAPGGEKKKIERLKGREWQLIRGVAYFASDWSVYPGDNVSGRNYITCGDGKTYASPKAGTILYYKIIGEEAGNAGESTNEASFKFTQDVNLSCGDKGEGTSSDSDSDEMTYTEPSSCGYDCVRYENFFYGTRAADIKQARFCSIYRGSSKGTGDNKGTLVEANRGYNINNIKPDYDKIGEACGEKCGEDTVCSTMGLWGGNSPVNMDENLTSSTETGASVYLWKKDPLAKNNNLYRLKEHDIKASVTPLFDIVGSIKTSETCGAGGDVRLVYHFDKRGDKYCGGEGKMCTVSINCGGETVDTKTFKNPGAPPGGGPSNPGSPYRYPTDYVASKKFLWKSARDNAPHNLTILIAGDYSDTCEVCVDGECHNTVGRMDGEDSSVFSPLDCYDGVGIMTENTGKEYNISEGVGCGVNVLAAGTVDYNDIFALLKSLEEKYPTTGSESSTTESSTSKTSTTGSTECPYSRVFIDGNLVASYGALGNNTALVGGAAGTSSTGTQPNGDRTHFRFSKPGKDYGNNVQVTFDDPQYNFVVEDGSKRKEFSDGRLWKPESDNDGNLVVLGPFHKVLTSCTVGGETVGSVGGSSEEAGCIYEYKTLPSYIKHDSPSSTTLSKETNGIVTDAVPIDKDRYVDFIGRNLSYKKINYYPYLFRFKTEKGKENNIENVSTDLKELLNKTSSGVNDVIVKNNGMPKKFVDRAETLTPELYELFKSIYTTYMLSGTPKEIDLYKDLVDLKVSTGSIDGGEKDISYLKTLEFALYWKNINNISEKYAFVLDNYLSDQLTNTKRYGLPKNKKMYELSYMGAPGDATSMYVKMDPEGKTTGSPYTKEESENASLDNMLSGINLGSSYDDAGNSKDDGEFECGPPEGVPIWEWIPAIICWLGTVLPPTIKIGQTECSTNSVFSTEETILGGNTGGSTTGTGGSSTNGWLNLESEEIKSCNGDFDKNGINDCVEKSLASGSLDLLTDSTKYAYNNNGIINIALKDKNGDIILSDNSTTVNVELSKLDLLNSDGSKTNIFTSGVGTEKEIQEKRNKANKYINFNDSYIKISKGEGQYAFSAKNKDVDAYIKAYIEIKDYKSTKKVYLEKIIKVEIRGNNFVATNYKIEKEDNNINITSGVDTVLASDATNIYLSDGKNTNIEDIKEDINVSSKSKQKLIFSLENYTESGTKIDLKYPLTVNLYKKNEKIVTFPKYFNFNQIKEYAPLTVLQKAGEYTLEVEDNEGFKFRKTFQVIADKAYSGEITLGSSILEIGGVISTNFLIVYDKYGNPVNSDLYKVSGEIDGNGIEFINGTEDKSKIDFQMLEGFKVFRTRTTNNTDDNNLIFKVSDSSGKEVLEVENNIKTVEGVRLFLQPLQKEIKISSGTSTGNTLGTGSTTGTGSEIYGYRFSVRNENGDIMTDFNSRLYLSLSSIYGKSVKSFVSVKNGTGEVYFTTKTVADPNVKLSFQIEGLKNIYTKYVDILPEKPIKMDLILNRNKIEAKESDYAILKVELKDRYGNLVFNDNSTNIGLEIKSEYKDFLSVNTSASTGITFRSSGSTFTGLPFVFSGTTFVASGSTNSGEILLSSGSKFISSGPTIVSSGSILFKINATKIPGESYIKVKAIPGFESSSFTINGQTPVEKTTIETMTGFTDKSELTSTGKIFFREYDRYNYVSKFYKLEDLEKSKDFLNLPIDNQKVLKSFWNKNNEIKVNAQNENIAKIETFYFWNKDKIDGNYYNSLYTVLLGAEYGDITQNNYLAGSILFDKNNRGLTVTSLLNNPYNYNDIVLINSNGKLKTVEDSQNLTQDIGYIANLDSKKKLYFDIYNYALSEHLGKIYYNLDNGNDLKVCDQTGITFADCTNDLDKTTILLKGIKEGYSGSIDGSELQLKDSFGEIIFKVNKDGEISYNPNITIENYVSEDDLDDSNEAIFSIKEGGDVIGIFSYNLINGKLNTTKDESLLEQKMNSLKNSIIVYLNTNKYGSRYFESKENSSLAIYYNDPFASENDLNTFSQAPGFTNESFKENYKAGWSESNKALLLYSAGETVGESTKKYASFSLINLGDPVVKLKNVKEKFPSDMKDDKPKCSEIEWIDKDICDRKVASDLKVSVGGISINLDQKITDILENDTTTVEVPVVGNPWVIYKKGGKWTATTWERMGPNSKSKFLNALEVDDWKPKDGETYGFIVSGLVRMGTHNKEIRSSIAWLKWGSGEDSESEKKTGSGTIYRSFDSTTGKQISKDEKNIGYKTFDYNNDNLQDVLLLKNDSYVEIIENRGKFDFATKGNLVYMPEMGAGGIIEAGDFTGDGYDDIFYVSKGKPYLLNNVEKNFYKIPLEEQFNLSGSIIKTSAFDMDNDKIKDIVTLDSAGKITIFYGGAGTSKNPEFAKLEVGDGYALYLNEDKDDGDGAIYYNGLDDKTTDSMLSNIKEENKSLVKDFKLDTDKKSVNLQFIDNIIYDKVSYNLNDESATGILDNSKLQDNNFGDSYNAVSNGINDMEEYSNSNIDGGGNNVQSKSFVRNKYAPSFGFDIKKEYKDLDEGKLNPLDKVKVVVKIKNTSGQFKRKVAYAEKIPSMFNFSEEEGNIKIGKGTATRTSTGATIKYNVGDYNFLIDGFSLAAGEEISLEYEVELIPLSYGDIKTGYFETGEAGDDEYGDIVIKTDKKSCNANPDIFRSISTGLTTTGSLVHTGVTSDITNYSGAYDVVADGDFAYMTSFLSDRVNVFDVSDSTNPVQTGSIVDNGGTIKLNGATGIIKKGNYLYVASNEADTLQVIDVSDPMNPKAKGQLVDTTALDGIRGLAISGNYIYTTVGNYDALQVIDISNPTIPKIVGTLRDTTTLNGARDIKIVGNYAYVSSYEGNGLSIINITNPNNPVLEGNITDSITLEGAWGVEVSGNYVYVSSYSNNSVKVIDIRDPENPKSVTDISGGNYFINSPIDLLVDGNKLYVTSFEQDAINVIDISNPKVPKYIKKVVNNDVNPLLDGPVNIFKVGNLIYTAVYNSSALEILYILPKKLSPGRAYEKGIASSTCNSDTLELPEEFQKNGLDEDKNGVPDYIDDLVESAGAEDKTKAITYATGALNKVNEDNDSDGVPDTEDTTPSYDTENDSDDKEFLTSINEGVDDVSEGIDKVANGLCNGFGGGGCISSPVNWAPLAPGNDPSVMGFPVGDGQKTGEGLPIFSAVLQNGCGYVKVWPPCPNGAGGRLDGKDDGKGENSFRLFVTPTITGAIGLAICFGQNNQSKNESPPSLFPIIGTQGKCIIVAFPFAGCSGNGSDGDVQQKNYAENFASSGGGAGKEETRGNFGVANGSCVDQKEQAKSKDFSFDENFMSNYMSYKQTGSEQAMSGLVDTFADIGRGTNNVLETQPLVELGDGTEHGDKVDVSFIAEINVSALANGEFKDVIKLKNTLISGFPQFLMEWVNRQIEEIVTKLTSFPSLIVILPDFSGIADYKWGNFFDGIKSNFNTGKQEWASTEQNLSQDLVKTQQKISDMKCNEKTASDDGYFECMTLQLQEQKQVLEKDFNPSQTTSGIKAVYDFIGSLPMVNLKSQTVNVNVPWITKTSLLKAKVNFEITKKQREEEIARVNEKRGSLSGAQKSAGDKIIVDAKSLIRSLDKNIAVIEEYKKFPENLVKLLNKKEDRLNQIMCSVDTIYKLFGGRLGNNGKRFKAWVELYVLIKAILKSWQIILDLFDEYDKSCKECKNERFDLRTFIWRLVSMIIPKIPVVQFPKWPNIVIDLHNIKVGLDITLPDFNFNTRPIVIPSLPKLYLPDVPSVKIKLPTLPILPSIKIPELPDLPTLPTIELPNLPPPPKLPKILSVIEVVINILKIVTKIQCILQHSPFAPERTAGTKIAYLTDRQGFMSLDFLDMTLPQYSFAFVDSIDVTTYVNFEVDADFIMEFVKQGVKPLNNFTNDVVNLFNNKLPDLDFSNVLPDTVNVNLSNKTGMLKNSNSTNLDGRQITNKAEITELSSLAKFFVYGFYNIYSYIQNNNEETVSNKEFTYLVNKGLANKNLGSEENIGKLRTLWKDVADMTYSKEDKIINDLKAKNKAKFDTLKSIINTEKQVTKDQINSIKDFKDKSNIKLIDSITTSNVEGYNELMRKHNFETVKSTINLLSDNNKEQKDLQSDGSKLLARVSTGLNSSMEKLVALNNQNNTTATTGTASTCSSGTGGELYKYNYKGLYVVEKKEKLKEEMTPQEIIDEQNLPEDEKPKKENYRLFDYIEELGGSEEINHVDFDNDGDEDVLYMVKGELYVKENTKKTVKTKNEISDALVLDINDNKFFNGDIYYEALNNIKEAVSFDSFINFSFDAPTDDSINNFKLEFFSIIDKYLNENHDEYIPKGIKKNVIDSFADIDNVTKIKEKSQTGYTVSKNLAYINNVGNTINDNIKLTTKDAVNIKPDLASGSLVSLSVDTKLYSGRTPFILGYYKGDSEDKNEITVGSFQNIKFNEKIRIFSLEGNAYVEGKDEKTLSGQTIKDYLYLPLFSGTRILLEKDNVLFNESSHIDIRYYDGTENNIDFRDTRQYELYDLGQKKTTYMVYTKEDNDYYYARALPFKEGVLGTRSNQVLLSPQISSDTTKPELNLDEGIKVPIYQEFTYDFTPYLDDTSGFSDFYIDMDLKVDSDNDGDATNDRDLDKPKIRVTTKTVKVKFGPFQELINKNVGITLKDLAGNATYKEVPFEVYAPDLEIDNHTGTTISGKLSEELLNEPVNLYRYRGGVISKMLNNAGSQKIYTNSSGAYTFSVKPENYKGLDITKDGVKVASINENTGKITINNLPGSNIKVISSNNSENDKSYVKMILGDNIGDIFYQYFNFNGLGDLSYVDKFQDINTEGIYVKVDNGDYDYYQLPLTVPYNPGVISIYSTSDSDKTALFSIFPDGKIYTKDNTYKLEYSTYGDNIVFKLYDSKKDIYVGEVLMKVVEGNYIVK